MLSPPPPPPPLLSSNPTRVSVSTSPNKKDQLEIETTVAPHSVKPPSIYHTFNGDEQSQDIFAEAIRKAKRPNERFKVLYPGSDDFEMERYGVWNHDSICVPALILQPRNSQEVSSCIRGYNAGLRQCLAETRRTGTSIGLPRLCIASGRTSIASMKEGAIVLDLSKMNRVKLTLPPSLLSLKKNKNDDPKQQQQQMATATVQGGAIIQDLDRTTAQAGFMCVTGTCQYLGVVGCILGGGYGYASRKYGLACDNVVKAEVVLGDGSIKRCTDKKKSDLLWTICGGGGGIVVVTSLTLKCYPICNTAVVTCSLSASSYKARYAAVKEWEAWINGHGDTHKNKHDNAKTSTGRGVPNEVYSLLILSTKKGSVLPCLATSIDTNAIPQSEEYLELYRDMTASSNSISIMSPRKSKSNKQDLPVSWNTVPGLSELRTNKLGSRMCRNPKFRMLRYNELQKVSDEYTRPGNVFVAYKYANTLSDAIVEILVTATTGSKTPNQDCRIFLSTLGGAIGQVEANKVAFDSRESNFVIYIEGRWSDTNKAIRDRQEKEGVIEWVRWLCNSLHLCKGIKSTAHPESIRDQVSKSGRSEPPPGWYNFGPQNGKRLLDMKRAKDRKNTFSLASRVSCMGFAPAASAATNPTTEKSSARHDKASRQKQQGEPPFSDAAYDRLDGIDGSGRSGLKRASLRSTALSATTSGSLSSDEELEPDDFFETVPGEDYNTTNLSNSNDYTDNKNNGAIADGGSVPLPGDDEGDDDIRCFEEWEATQDDI